jgi:Lrp/AsnC family transcriptional regulator for asnA, asnC and gidA
MARALDELDRRIITLLQQDSRMPSAEIARKLGVAERTVRARISRLVDEGVVRLLAVLNPAAIGYEVTADIFLEVEPSRLQDVAQQLVTLPEVSYVGITTGDRDISIQVYVPSVDALYHFITEKLTAIPGVLGTKTYIVPRILKSLTMWSLPEHAVIRTAGGRRRSRASAGDRPRTRRRRTTAMAEESAHD